MIVAPLYRDVLYRIAIYFGVKGGAAIQSGIDLRDRQEQCRVRPGDCGQRDHGGDGGAELRFPRLQDGGLDVGIVVRVKKAVPTA
jgi:hypothetical protein